MTFERRKEKVKWEGQEITMIEPTVAEALNLSDQYFDILVRGTGDNATAMVKVKEAEYIRTVCRKFLDPPIDVDRLPAKMYRSLRKLINRWEEWAGILEVREALEAGAQGNNE